MTIKMEELLDREQIKEVIYTYCKNVDAKNWDGVRACFTDDCLHTAEAFGGNNDGFIATASTVIGQTDGTLHSIGGVLITMDGDDVRSEATFIAFHLIKAGTEGYLETKHVDEDWTVGGRYVDKWRKTPAGWRICERRLVQDWARREDAVVS